MIDNVLIITDDEFEHLQKSFLDNHWQEFENKEENKLTYMAIFKEYVCLLFSLYLTTFITYIAYNFDYELSMEKMLP